MLRNIVSVVAGYLAMAIFVFATFTIAYLVLGADRAFEPGTYEVSLLWIATSFLLGFLGAILGGFICATIARNSRAPMALAGVVLVLGLVLAIPVITADRSQQPERTSEVGSMEAMQGAIQPIWIALVNPVLGAVGIILGARMRSGSRDGNAS